MNLAVAVNRTLEIKESQKKDKYLEPYQKTKKKTMELTVMPVVIGTLGTKPKGVVKGLEDMEIRGQIQTIKTTEL